MLQLDVIKVAQLNTLFTVHAANLTQFNSNKRTEKYKSSTIILNTENETNFSKNILEYKDFELNNMKYEDALKNDKRNFFQYYFALLKINHLFMFSFCSDRDYNSKIIKIFLFLFFFSVYFIVNALFFNDATMHKIYVDEGTFNFVYQIPQIIYSSLITLIIITLIKFLSLSQSSITELKQDRRSKDLDKRYKKLIRNLKIKFITFFSITAILLIFFCFYISCFCGIYENTQVYLIKDTLINFSFSCLYPIFLSLFPGIFRFISLRSKKQNKKCMYKFSKFIQYI